MEKLKGRARKMQIQQNSLNLNLETVIDLVPWRLGVIIRKAPGKVEMIVLKQKAFSLFKFELISWVKKKADPDDRVLYFETLNDHGCYDWEREQRLIRSRMTKSERERGSS